GSLEIVDNLTKLATTFAPAKAAFLATPVFVPQGLTAEQTMRVTLTADPPSPCIASVSFNDGNGKPLGTTTPVSLSPGQSTVVDFNARTLTLELFQRIDVQPVVALTSPPASAQNAAAPQQASACPATVEVFDHFTGRTWTSQVSGTEQ
ncbi:MAG TPA: hypothetical protein VI756_03610, partial [Blastocatellia bacterium]